MQEMLMERTSFKSITESDEPISEDIILAWLSNSEDVEFEYGNNLLVDAHPTYSLTIDNIPTIDNLTIFNLEPVSVGVLIAGLSAILAWVSTERRHKETLASKPPGNNTNNNSIDTPDVCKKIDAGVVCKLPLTNTMQVKGSNFLILFRACTKKPEPHTTVVYYEL